MLAFFFLQEQLARGDDAARCPSCSLVIRVIYDPEDFVGILDDDEEGADEAAHANHSTAVTVA